jgi:hypothetical protein
MDFEEEKTFGLTLFCFVFFPFGNFVFFGGGVRFFFRWKENFKLVSQNWALGPPCDWKTRPGQENSSCKNIFSALLRRILA